MPALNVVSRLFADLRSAPRMMAKRRSLRRALFLRPDQPLSRRSPDDWKLLRKRTIKEARQSLEAGQSKPAIRLLSVALVEDPHHAPYHELLRQAAAQKRHRKGARQRQNQEASMEHSAQLSEATQQLEAFVAYSQALTTLMPKAVLKPLAPGPARLKDGKPR